MSTDFTLFVAHGRLTEDPKIYETESGKNICRFTVASNRRIGPDEERTAFIPVVVYNNPDAENCYKYLSKGRSVYVQGTFETNKRTAKDGNVYNNFDLVADKIQFGSGGARSKDADVDEAVSKIASKIFIWSGGSTRKVCTIRAFTMRMACGRFPSSPAISLGSRPSKKYSSATSSCCWLDK